MNTYDYTGSPNQPPQNVVYINPDNPYHQRVLGYNVYQGYYDAGYTAPRGCCGMPFAFWLFLLGIFFPPLWLISACCLFSRNPYERLWGRASLFAFILTAILAVIFGAIGGFVWWR